MIILWACFMLLEVFGEKLIEYRLGYNFGQVFQDFSYNSQTAVNGLSSADTISDVVFTDRGAYFDGNSAQVTLPANDQASTYFHLPSDFSISIWVNSESVDGLIFYRYKDDSNFFYIERINSGKKIQTRLVLGALDTGEKKSSGDAFSGSTWVLITLIISEMQLKIYSNLNCEITTSLSCTYTETETYNTLIGGMHNTHTALKGFIYYFIISDDTSFYTSLILNSAVTTCLNENGGCPNSCNPAIVDPYKGTGCLPIHADYVTDSLGNTCNCLSNSCINELCLECNCNTLSCILDTNIIYCYCPIGYYSSNNQCLECDISCLICESELTCLTCKTTYAQPDSYECLCITGYYPIEPLTNPDSCAICYEECESCQDYNLCLSCVSENADLSLTGCQCKDGYWGNHPLNSIDSCQICHEDCSSCENSYNCLLCKSTYAISSTIGCKCQTGYWGSNPLTQEDSCQPCYEECSECDNNLNCLSCKSRNSIALKDKGCKCNDGYWNDTSLISEDSCQKCFDECSLCENGYSCLDCISINSIPKDNGCQCIDGYYAIGALILVDSCIQCNKECLTCQEASLCDDCIAAHAVPDKISGCVCENGYYNIKDLSYEDACLPCGDSCLQCIGPDTCSSCKDPNAILSFDNTCICDNGYYYDNKSSLCSLCNSDCEICTNNEACSSCSSSMINSQSSLCLCKDGYFTIKQNSILCSPCIQDCLTCDNSYSCLTCKKESANFISQTCECPDNSYEESYKCLCNPGFYMSFNENLYSCDKCSSKCQTCLSLSICLSCVDPNETISDSGICQKSCNKNEYLYNGICTTCKELCLACESYEICTKCNENSILSDGVCQCIKGYIEADNSCISSNFTAKLDINANNKLQLKFEKTLEVSLIIKDMTIITIPNINFDIKIYEYSTKIYYITPTFGTAVEKNTALTLTIIKNPLYSQDNSLLTTYKFSVILNPVVNDNVTPFSTATTKTVEAAAQTVVTTSIGTSIVSNPAAVWALINTLQLIHYLPLGSTPMTKGLQEFCSTLGNYNIIPNPMHMFFSYNLTTPPYHEAKDFGLETSVFLINIGPNLLILISFIVLWPFIFLLSKLATGGIQRKANTLLKKYKYRFFIRFWTQVYIDTIIYSLIQLKSVILI